MKLKKIYYLVVMLSCTMTVYAEKLNQQQYDQQVNGLYSALLKQQDLLNQELDGKKDIKKIIGISCDYVGNLTRLKKLSLENINLKDAKDEAEQAQQLIQEYDLSFQHLGTTYQKSCT